MLRSLSEGATSHSHGIHVARLAGMQGAVVERAKEILARLEQARDRSAVFEGDEPGAAVPAQMALYADAESRMREELKRLDVSTMTPMDAINILYRLSEEAKK